MANIPPSRSIPGQYTDPCDVLPQPTHGAMHPPASDTAVPTLGSPLSIDCSSGTTSTQLVNRLPQSNSVVEDSASLLNTQGSHRISPSKPPSRRNDQINTQGNPIMMPALPPNTLCPPPSGLSEMKTLTTSARDEFHCAARSDGPNFSSNASGSSAINKQVVVPSLVTVSYSKDYIIQNHNKKCKQNKRGRLDDSPVQDEEAEEIEEIERALVSSASCKCLRLFILLY